jgi:hypothetical protein
MIDFMQESSGNILGVQAGGKLTQSDYKRRLGKRGASTWQGFSWRGKSELSHPINSSKPGAGCAPEERHLVTIDHGSGGTNSASA